MDSTGQSATDLPNPFGVLLDTCQNEPRQIQAQYEVHRQRRNREQKELILSTDFHGWNLDQHLQRLHGPRRQPCYQDPRHNVTLISRPEESIRKLVDAVQKRLAEFAPHLWFVPLDHLHMTLLEITHSTSSQQVARIAGQLVHSCEAIANLINERPRAGLIKPLLCFDSSALALSFLPDTTPDEMRYTYHHLRRDLWDKTVTESGVRPNGRYVVPSGHMTVARLTSVNVFSGDPDDESVTLHERNRRQWMEHVEAINTWLWNACWLEPNKVDSDDILRWTVGQEEGLEFRTGRNWYGGGDLLYKGPTIKMVLGNSYISA